MSGMASAESIDQIALRTALAAAAGFWAVPIGSEDPLCGFFQYGTYTISGGSDFMLVRVSATTPTTSPNASLSSLLRQRFPMASSPGQMRAAVLSDTMNT